MILHIRGSKEVIIDKRKWQTWISQQVDVLACVHKHMFLHGEQEAFHVSSVIALAGLSLYFFWSLFKMFHKTVFSYFYHNQYTCIYTCL